MRETQGFREFQFRKLDQICGHFFELFARGGGQVCQRGERKRGGGSKLNSQKKLTYTHLSCLHELSLNKENFCLLSL